MMAAPTTETVTNTPTTQAPIKFQVDCAVGRHDFVPSEDHCERFYECNEGIKHMHHCPEGQIFNYYTKDCGLNDKSVCYFFNGATNKKKTTLVNTFLITLKRFTFNQYLVNKFYQFSCYTQLKTQMK